MDSIYFEVEETFVNNMGPSKSFLNIWIINNQRDQITKYLFSFFLIIL